MTPLNKLRDRSCILLFEEFEKNIFIYYRRIFFSPDARARARERVMRSIAIFCESGRGKEEKN